LIALAISQVKTGLVRFVVVVNNSWGIFHPSLDEFPPSDPRRYIDNPNHPFRLYILISHAEALREYLLCPVPAPDFVH
jgi:hypothetical protein